MPKYICEYCKSHFPKGIYKCPKCSNDFNIEKVEFSLPSMTINQWLVRHNNHQLKPIKAEKTKRYMVKCLDCTEYYLL